LEAGVLVGADAAGVLRGVDMIEILWQIIVAIIICSLGMGFLIGFMFGQVIERDKHD
jgi:uncharacterized membrane protein YraQ (UPF0718 family)